MSKTRVDCPLDPNPPNHGLLKLHNLLCPAFHINEAYTHHDQEELHPLEYRLLPNG